MSNSSNGSAAGGIGLVTVLLALIFLFVWPGPLRYEYHDYIIGQPKQAIHTLIKIDRISGQFWLYNNGRWEKQTK